MENDSKRKQTFVDYVLEKLKSRLDDSQCAKTHDYTKCRYSYNDADGGIDESIREEQECNDIDIACKEAPKRNKNKKKFHVENSERIYQASLPIEGLEVIRKASDKSCESDSDENSEQKKGRKRKRKRRQRHRNVVNEDNMEFTEDQIENEKIPILHLDSENKEDNRLLKKKLKKEAKIASIRAGLKNDAHSLAKIWNDFFEARFTLVTENAEDTLPGLSNQIHINTGQAENHTKDTTNDNRSASNNSSELSYLPKEKSLANAFERQYQELERSPNNSEEDLSAKDDKVEIESKCDSVKLTKNQRRKQRKKRRQFYLRKEAEERKNISNAEVKEKNIKMFEKTKEEVIAFFDSIWDIFQQEKKDKLNHDDLEKARLSLLEVFEEIQKLEMISSTIETLLSIKKWLLLLDNSRAKAMLQIYLESHIVEGHKFVVKELVEYWVTSIAPSLGVN